MEFTGKLVRTEYRNGQNGDYLAVTIQPDNGEAVEVIAYDAIANQIDDSFDPGDKITVGTREGQHGKIFVRYILAEVLPSSVLLPRHETLYNDPEDREQRAQRYAASAGLRIERGSYYAKGGEQINYFKFAR